MDAVVEAVPAQGEGEDVDEVGEEFVADAAVEPEAEECAGDGEGEKFEGEGGGDLGEHAGGVVGGELGGIKDEEIERAGANVVLAVEAEGEDVHGDDRAGGVGEGGGDGAERAGEMAAPGFGHEFDLDAAIEAPPVEGDEDDGFAADAEGTYPADALRHGAEWAREINGVVGEARSFDRLDELLVKQFYRLAYWRAGPDEINYRRFFDCNDLAALAMEREEVFKATQTFTLSRVAEGKCDGLRIDHPDGLYDPAQYLRRLQIHYVMMVAEKIYEGDESVKREVLERIATGYWLLGTRGALYVVVEKILGVGEKLRGDWVTAGTSGYEVLNEINGLFVDGRNKQAMTEAYEAFVGKSVKFGDLVYEKKKLAMQMLLASELHMLAHRLDGIAQRNRRSRDFTFLGLLNGLREVIACFPVYRSYVTDEGVGEEDRKLVMEAIECAKRRNPRMDAGVFGFIREVLLLERAENLGEEARHERLRFAGKFQQVTSPVTAKGIEDTAFYQYSRLASLNEVGGSPERFGVPAEELHAYFAERAKKYPFGLTALSTHDTKRSEDVRARMNVLSEIPAEWRERVMRWREMNARYKSGNGPTEEEEYLLYQTLVGSWTGAEEGFVARIQNYMRKAMREAKVRSYWTDVNETNEGAVVRFVAAILNEGKSAEFLRDFREFQERVARAGVVNSLAQTVLKLAGPGVADTYQGTEVMDFSLVDPDNRRGVDYGKRRKVLEQAERAGARWRCVEGVDYAVALARPAKESEVVYGRGICAGACPGRTRGEFICVCT